MSGYSLDLRKKIVESVKKGVPKAETARRFGVDRATVKRYCKQLLLEDLEQRPWATHSQRAEFLFAASGVRVSEATVCRAVGRLRRSRKKDPSGQQKETSF